MSDQETKDDTMEFDLVRQEVPVKMKDKDGSVAKYVLRELDGLGREKYLNELRAKMNVGTSGKVTGIKSFSGLQSILLIPCLRKQNEDGTESAVSEEFLNGLPASVLSKLFDRANQLNGFNKEAENEAKND